MSYPISSSLLDGIVLAVVERESTYGFLSLFYIFENRSCTGMLWCEHGTAVLIRLN